MLRTNLLTLAATMALGTGVLAQVNMERPATAPPPGTSGGGTGAGSTTPPAEGGAAPAAGANNQGAGTATGGMDRAPLVAAGLGDAQVLGELAKIRQTPENAGDKLFVLHNACGNLMEVRLSELVARRSQNKDIQSLANMIAKDHSDANTRLATVAQELGVTLPTELGAAKLAELSIKEQMPVADLEKGYLSHMKAVHAKDITMFADKAQTAKSERLKGYIGEVLPKLRQHGKHVVEAAQKMGLKGDLNAMSASAD
jgi:putative membrane protein